jgi:hypothetical protein
MAQHKKIKETSLLAIFPMFLFFFLIFGCTWVSFFVSLALSVFLSILMPSFLVSFLGMGTHEAYAELFKTEGFRGLDEFPYGLLTDISEYEIPVFRSSVGRLYASAGVSGTVVTPLPIFLHGFFIYIFVRLFVDFYPFWTYVDL